MHDFLKKIKENKKTAGGLLSVFLITCIICAYFYLPVAGVETQDNSAPVVAESEPFLPVLARPEHDAAQDTVKLAVTDEELASEAKNELSTIRGTINRGDTAGSILQAWLTSAEISSLDAACKGVMPLRRIKQGHTYTVQLEDGNFVAFEYEVDADTRLVVVREGEGFKASKAEIEYEIVLHRVEGTIQTHLFQAMNDSGERPVLAVLLADVFGWEINFIRDLRVGDKFTLLVEKRYLDGQLRDYGKLLAATFVNQGVTYEAYLYTDEKQNQQYFTAKGENLRRAFLKAPLSFSRISSGYSNRRLHPVHMDWRSHPAIDYAAPQGTPVKAVGKGTVVHKAYSESAGNFIILQHLNNYQTMYMHLSGFAKDLKKGQHVKQGQVIGFVGKTGYATGPHLDFRMKKNGQYINPLTALSPRDTPISPKEMPGFESQIAIYRDFLEFRRNLAEYKRSLLPSFN